MLIFHYIHNGCLVCTNKKAMRYFFPIQWPGCWPQKLLQPNYQWISNHISNNLYVWTQIVRHQDNLANEKRGRSQLAIWWSSQLTGIECGKEKRLEIWSKIESKIKKVPFYLYQCVIFLEKDTCRARYWVCSPSPRVTLLINLYESLFSYHRFTWTIDLVAPHWLSIDFLIQTHNC